MASPLGLTNFSNVRYTTGDNQEIGQDFTGKYNSVLNGSKFYYRPTISQREETETITYPNGSTKEKTVKVTEAQGERLHDSEGNDMYNISTGSILEYTEGFPSMQLKAADFAYLRDLGVYPNNRLIVCRRFPSPVENDLTAVNMSPMSSMVSWIPDSEDTFFSFSLGEEWSPNDTEDPLKDLTDIFNEIFTKTTGIDVQKQGSGMLGGIIKKLPMGGLAEALETTVTNYLLGDRTTDGTNFKFDNLPKGNPNFMGKSAYRKMNSITSEISIDVKSTFEMKYINGIDPTIAYMDILQNILRFSSSQSVFYIAQGGGDKIKDFFTKYRDGDWIGALTVIADAIVVAMRRVLDNIGTFIDEVKNTVSNAVSGGGESDDTEEGEEEDSQRKQVEDKTSSIINKFTSFIGSSSMANYRIKFSQILPAMTGESSAPWHVTIGNPKNPFFSSGDMIVSEAKVDLGNTLGFNDLPTKLTFSFTIKSARDLGIQEIFDKFNVGTSREYQRQAIEFRTDFYQGSVKNYDL